MHASWQPASHGPSSVMSDSSATKVPPKWQIQQATSRMGVKNEPPCTKTTTSVALESANPPGTGRRAERQAGCGEATHSEPVMSSKRCSKWGVGEVMTHQILRQSNEWSARRIRETLLNRADSALRCVHHVASARRRIPLTRAKKGASSLRDGRTRQAEAPQKKKADIGRRLPRPPRPRRATSRPTNRPRANGAQTGPTPG